MTPPAGDARETVGGHHMDPKRKNLLYHYTCTHGATGIELTREIRPNQHPWMARGVVWLTDLDNPDRTGLGLTMEIIDCDRTEYRYAVPWDPSMIWWPTYAKYALSPATRCDFERFGRKPETWWVTEFPIDLPQVKAP